MSEKKLAAIVNGKEISQDDVLRFLNDIGPQMAMQFQSPEGIERVVDELVNQELLYLDAMEEKMDEEDEFKELLEATKINLLKNYAFNKLIGDETASDSEVADFYNENKELFGKEETVVASHILVEDEDLAKEIIEEIDEGLSFEDAAMKHSTCPSKEAGGNLGEFSRGQMVPEFEEKAFVMEEGTISEPVKTQFGFHIIKLISKNPAAISTFEEAKDVAYEQVLRMKQQQKYVDKINGLMTKYKVERFN